MSSTDLSDERAFRAEVSRTLGALIRQLDDVESDDLDARLSEGNLTTTFEQGGTFMLSQQTPTRELWLSANMRAWHFRWAGAGWVERDTGEPLAQILGQLYSEKLGFPVQFEL